MSVAYPPQATRTSATGVSHGGAHGKEARHERSARPHRGERGRTPRAVLDTAGGRDELSTGEMWNSNSVISWLLVMAGVAGRAGSPPNNGRAPGWHAGLVVARREITARSTQTR